MTIECSLMILHWLVRRLNPYSNGMTIEYYGTDVDAYLVVLILILME